MHNVRAGDYGLPLLCLEAEAYDVTEVTTQKHTHTHTFPFHNNWTVTAVHWETEIDRHFYVEIWDVLH